MLHLPLQVRDNNVGDPDGSGWVDIVDRNGGTVGSMYCQGYASNLANAHIVVHAVNTLFAPYEAPTWLRKVFNKLLAK